MLTLAVNSEYPYSSYMNSLVDGVSVPTTESRTAQGAPHNAILGHILYNGVSMAAATFERAFKKQAEESPGGHLAVLIQSPERWRYFEATAAKPDKRWLTAFTGLGRVLDIRLVPGERNLFALRQHGSDNAKLKVGLIEPPIEDTDVWARVTSAELAVSWEGYQKEIAAVSTNQLPNQHYRIVVGETNITKTLGTQIHQLGQTALL